MKRYVYFIGITLCSIGLAYLFIWLGIKYESPVHKEDTTLDYYEQMVKAGYHYIETNRIIGGNNYIASSWYKAEDPNIEAYLDLIEKEDENMPVLYYSASDPNDCIYIVQQTLMRADGGRIEWPEADANDYERFRDKKITLHSGSNDYLIGNWVPIDADGDMIYDIYAIPKGEDSPASDDWSKSSAMGVYRGKET